MYRPRGRSYSWLHARHASPNSAGFVRDHSPVQVVAVLQRNNRAANAFAAHSERKRQATQVVHSPWSLHDNGTVPLASEVDEPEPVLLNGARVWKSIAVQSVKTKGIVRPSCRRS